MREATSLGPLGGPLTAEDALTPTEDEIVKLQKAIGVDRLQAIYHLRGRAAIRGNNLRPAFLRLPYRNDPSQEKRR